jgi:hypothetical protein
MRTLLVGSTRFAMTGSLTLSLYPGEIVRLSCPRCGRAGQYRKQNLIERYGADIRLPDSQPFPKYQKVPIKSPILSLWCIMDILDPGGLGDLKEFTLLPYHFDDCLVRPYA